jgi:flavin-dependent dehydrogenase
MVYTERAPLVGEVVGAFGLDEGTGVVFQRAVGYQPPPALSSIVTKYHPGDAAGLVRAFKGKGVTSAIQTGLRAARVILGAGVSERALGDYLEANRDIIADLPYGQAMRGLTILAARLGTMGLVLDAAEADPGLRRALFDSAS